MINPFLKFPIYGAIWYQGESNTGNSHQYACAIKAMVGDWRAKWNNYNAEMDDTFPFGQVSLAGWRNQDISTGFTDIRWAQTDSQGYTPHSTMQKFFLAIAADLPDYNSPSGDIHPRYKRQIADRLALAAFNVAYGNSTVFFQGPIPTAYARDGANVRVTYAVPLQFRDTSSIFELCCGAAATNTCSAGGRWVVSSFVSGRSTDLLITNPCGGSEFVTGFRYIWRESPCPLEQCPVYSVQNNLPAPPYLYNGLIA
jgi:sialate O-acetylesterase